MVTAPEREREMCAPLMRGEKFGGERRGAGAARGRVVEKTK
jgi:hypothetical protein